MYRITYRVNDLHYLAALYALFCWNFPWALCVNVAEFRRCSVKLPPLMQVRLGVCWHRVLTLNKSIKRNPMIMRSRGTIFIIKTKVCLARKYLMSFTSMSSNLGTELCYHIVILTTSILHLHHKKYVPMLPPS